MFNRVVNKTYRTIYRRVQSPQQIKKLRQHSDIYVRKLGESLKAALNHQASAEESEWIRKIEDLRGQLADSTRLITVMDYGADAHQVLSEEEMYQGRQKTITVAEACKVSKPAEWAFILFSLMRHFAPVNSLELGTNVGISAAYQGAALKLNQRGHLVTLEGAEALADLAVENWASLGLTNIRVVKGRFQDTVADVLKELAPLDYAFIDGHHDEQATVDYFEQILPVLNSTAVLVFDDISWSDGMKRAWVKICEHPRVGMAVNMLFMGICLISPSSQEKQVYDIY